MIIKKGISLISLILMMGCKIAPEDISLKTWISDERVFLKFIEPHSNNCGYVNQVFKELKTKEFKDKMYSELTNCSLNNNELLKEYLIKSVESGLNPSRIDSNKYSSVYHQLKPKLIKAQQEFWKNKDTTFYLEIEKRVKREQKLANEYRNTGLSEINELRNQLFIDDTKYLLNYCREKGFPQVPKLKNFKTFRTKINPTIIAVHADPKSKLELLDYAIESARIGKNSWSEPISICIALHSNDIKKEETKPLFLLEFDKNQKLDINKSYLQLYSIYKFYHEDMGVRIKIQPSRFYNGDALKIKEQLYEVKNFLIDEFDFSSDYIKLSNISDKTEKDYRNIHTYAFTLSIMN